MKKRTQSKTKVGKKAVQAQRRGVVQPPPSEAAGLDCFKWGLAFLILIISIAANYYYIGVSWAIRTSIGIPILSVVAVILYHTRQGKIAFSFLKAAKTEMRKVVWPTRQETIRTTFLVAGIVLLAGIILWGLDSSFIWAVARIMSIN
jgi:preprotein translocase subunit SecE